MINRSALILISVFALIFSSCKKQEEKGNLLNHQWLAEAPAYTLYTQIHKAGETIIPNGRIITPPNRTFQVAPHPYGLSLSHDGNTIVTANSGTSPLSITIIRKVYDEQPEIQQIPDGAKTDKGILASVFMGLAISPDNKIVYVGGGQENKIFLFDIKTGKKAGYIDCNTGDEENDYSHGYIGDLVLSRDGKTLYAVDQTNFRMIIADTETTKVTCSVKVGRYPFGITLSPDENKVYVANVGMFEYKKITGSDFDSLEETAMEFPPFAYLSEEATHGIHTDTLEVPGLGEPNVPEAFSVWIISLESKKPPKVIAKIKTGHLIGALIEGIPAVGGSSPNSLVATSDYVFVSNGNNDNISVIDIKNDSLLQHIQLTLDHRIDHLRGIIPFGLALSPDNKRLYVAESGINAIGVIDVESLKLTGHIPAGWFPSKLKVSRDGEKLIVANAKGYGSGPNGGPEFTAGPEGSYIGNLMKGSVSVINIPSDQELIQTTQKVISNNFIFNPVSSKKYLWRKENPVPLYPGNKPSPIKHIVFISKENRTYDEIFGQIENGKGEPSLARYGKNVTFSNQAKTKTVTRADIMPNHLTLAKKYAIADNFYVDSDVSADGHRWLVNTYPNEWVETNTAASYGGNRNFIRDSKAPGAPGMTGAAGAIYPEDYNEAGSMWEHLERHEVDFYNFGFGTMLEPAVYLPSFKYTGIKHIYNFPLPEPMFYKTSRIYATYNMAIPDQFRIDMFIKEFTEKWIEGEDKLPPVITVIIPNDHGAGERPEAGYPFRESYMADNDLAVGRIIEFLSGTSYWKNMAVFITEDDAQNGVDHIDAHRSILMVISPFAKKNYVGHVHYSFGSIFKTFWNILGIPYLNQYDACATDLADMFADTADYTPYNAIPVDERIFDPQKALDPFDEKFNWKAIEESPVLDDVKVMIKDSKEFDEKQDEKK